MKVQTSEHLIQNNECAFRIIRTSSNLLQKPNAAVHWELFEILPTFCNAAIVGHSRFSA